MIGLALVALMSVSARVDHVAAQPTPADRCLDIFQYQKDMRGMGANLDLLFGNISERLEKLEKAASSK